MPYGETLIFRSRMKDAIIDRLRECGCDETETQACWNSFLSSVSAFSEQLKQTRQNGDVSGLLPMIPSFSELVQNLKAADLSIYLKNLRMVLARGDKPAIERTVNDLLKLTQRYLDESED